MIDRKIMLPVGILLGGVALAAIMIASGGSAEKGTPEVKALPISTQTVTAEDLPVPVRGTGVVTAAQQVAMMPQVSGKIIETDPDLMPGARFLAGEVLAHIDPRDHQAMLEQARSNTQRAELELALETGRGEVAQREWEMLNQDGSEPTELALRAPQLALAEQNVVAARGALTQAKLNMQRTRLTSPFNAVVVSESIDLGQVVGPNTVVATLVGTDQLWVTVSLPMSEVDVLQFRSRDGQGSRATVLHRLAGGHIIEHIGEALQLGGALDPQTRLAQITVAVANPFDTSDGQIPLLPGSYVEVIFDGLVANQVIRVPRSALYDGDQVWINNGGKLAARNVQISGGDAESVLTAGGLQTGDELVVSALSLPIEGMPVQVVGGDQ
jgi:RND family efflux transporter MFP subunit